MSERVEVLFRVVSRDERGRPRQLVAIYDTDRVQLEGGAADPGRRSGGARRREGPTGPRPLTVLAWPV